MSGNWTSIGASPDAPGPNEPFSITQAAGSDNFTFHDRSGSAGGWITQANGYVTFPPSAGDRQGVVTDASGAGAGCDRVRWFDYESFIWCRAGADCATPSFRDAPELNMCADGSMPHEDVRINPCDPGVEYGVNFTVPAQQFNVIVAECAGEDEILYYGERANSAPDGLFSHNFQAWVPLKFTPEGGILPMTFPPSFQLDLVNGTR